MQCDFVQGSYIGEFTILMCNEFHWKYTDLRYGGINWFSQNVWFCFLEFSFYNFIKWIKLSNADIKAMVIKSGYLSKPINIECGCCLF